MSYLEHLQVIHGIISYLLGVLVSLILLLPKKPRIIVGLPVILAGFAWMMHIGLISQSLPIKDLPINATKTYEYISHKLVIENKKKYIVAWLNHDGKDRLFYFPYDRKLANAFQRAAKNQMVGIRGQLEIEIKEPRQGNDMIFNARYIPIKIPKERLNKNEQRNQVSGTE